MRPVCGEGGKRHGDGAALARPGPLRGERVDAAGEQSPYAAYRLSAGRLGSSAKGSPVALLTVPGRKTGAPHTVPVACLEHDGTYLVAGTSGGTKAEPQWFRNIRAARRVHIQIGAHGHHMNCRVAYDDERNRLWRDAILARHPFFAKYQERSGRIIPVAVLWP